MNMFKTITRLTFIIYIYIYIYNIVLTPLTPLTPLNITLRLKDLLFDLYI